MKSIIYALLIGLFSFLFFSCENGSDNQPELKLDKVYQKLANEYDSGKRVYGKYQSVKIFNDLEFEFFLEKVSFYAKNDMPQELAKMIRYPMVLNYFEQNKDVRLMNEKDFIKNYDIIMKNRLERFAKQTSFPLPVALDTLDKDKRVLIGEHGSIWYERSSEKGKESYKLIGFE